MVICLQEQFNNSVSDEFRCAINNALNLADKNGYEIFLIGGIVRDLIMNNKIKDIDIAVQGDAVNFAILLKENLNCEILNVQENLRTAKVKFLNGVVIDFASTREEKYSESGKLPVAYNFGCKLENDVKRRDFTINTLALKLTGDNKFSLVDYFDGYSDIKNKKIRILHQESFIDDPSRIIRALKFKERFDFELEEDTAILMQEYLSKINDKMPLERVKSEIRQYFEIQKVGLYSRLIESGAYKLISDNPFSNLDESKFIDLYGYNLFNKNDKWFIYILLLVVNSDYAIKRLNLTSFEKKVIKEVRALLKKKEKHFKGKYAIYNSFNKLSDFSLCAYYVMSDNHAVTKFLDALKEIRVMLTGRDLIDLGLVPSPYFNKIFDKVLREKLEGKLVTKEDELAFVKRFIKKGE